MGSRQGPSHCVWRPILLLLPVAFAAFALIAAIVTDFHQCHNDFWDTYFIVKHFRWDNPQSWYNPFHPVGNYALLSLIMGEGDPSYPAITANILIASLTLLECGFLYRKVISLPAAAISIVLLGIFPLFLHYSTAGGGDPASVLLFVTGFLLLTKASWSDQPGSRLSFAAGLLLGCAALFRYHALFGSMLLLGSWAVVYRSRLRQIAIATAGLLIAFIPQIVVTLASGHGIFKMGYGPVNLYDLMYGLNWYHTITLDIPRSALQVIALDPLLFVKKYLIALISYSYCFVPLMAAVILCPETRQRKIFGVAALWSIAYFGLFSATTSGRQPLLALPLTFMAIGWLTEALATGTVPFSRTVPSRARRFLVAFSLCAVSVVFVYKDCVKMGLRINNRQMFTQVEQECLRMGCTGGNQVFSTDFDLYFRNLNPFLPMTNGGAPRWGTYALNELYPEFPTQTLDTFAQACRDRGVRVVALIPACSLLTPDFGRLYNGERTSAAFAYVAEVGRFRLFRVTRTEHALGEEPSRWQLTDP